MRGHVSLSANFVCSSVQYGNRGSNGKFVIRLHETTSWRKPKPVGLDRLFLEVHRPVHTCEQSERDKGAETSMTGTPELTRPTDHYRRCTDNHHNDIVVVIATTGTWTSPVNMLDRFVPGPDRLGSVDQKRVSMILAHRLSSGTGSVWPKPDAISQN